MIVPALQDAINVVRACHDAAHLHGGHTAVPEDELAALAGKIARPLRERRYLAVRDEIENVFRRYKRGHFIDGDGI